MILPYLELPVCIGYGDGQESKVVKGKFQPVKVSCYHQGYHDEVGMFIYIEGQPIQIALTIEDYEAKIAAYWKYLADKEGAKKKLTIIN